VICGVTSTRKTNVLAVEIATRLLIVDLVGAVNARGALGATMVAVIDDQHPLFQLILGEHHA